MRHDILQTTPLSRHCEGLLAERYTVHKLYEAADREAMIAELADRVRAIAGHAADAGLMEKLPKLQMISNFGVGYDGIDTGAAKARGIRVTNTPDVLNDAVAEITIGLMIALARKIPQADRYVRDGRWPAANYPLQTELTGRTVGIVGLGRIGKEIAARCLAMRMRVVYFGRNRQPRQPYVYYGSLVDMARDADWLVLIAPGGEGTRRIVDREVLTALGPQGRLVNMARGTLVDEPALVEMLVAGELGGAALDVFENEPQVPAELLGLDNVVLSPHAGSATRETREDMDRLVVRNLEAFFAGEPLLTPVV